HHLHSRQERDLPAESWLTHIHTHTYTHIHTYTHTYIHTHNLSRTKMCLSSRRRSTDLPLAGELQFGGQPIGSHVGAVDHVRRVLPPQSTNQPTTSSSSQASSAAACSTGTRRQHLGTQNTPNDDER